MSSSKVNLLDEKDEKQEIALSSTALGAPRKMTLINGISTIVGLMIGSGIFSSAGHMEAHIGSSLFSLLMWGFTGLLALCGALWFVIFLLMF